MQLPPSGEYKVEGEHPNREQEGIRMQPGEDQRTAAGGQHADGEGHSDPPVDGGRRPRQLTNSSENVGCACSVPRSRYRFALSMKRRANLNSPYFSSIPMPTSKMRSK